MPIVLRICARMWRLCAPGRSLMSTRLCATLRGRVPISLRDPVPTGGDVSVSLRSTRVRIILPISLCANRMRGSDGLPTSLCSAVRTFVPKCVCITMPTRSNLSTSMRGILRASHRLRNIV